jgi:hypothetical protein
MKTVRFFIALFMISTFVNASTLMPSFGWRSEQVIDFCIAKVMQDRALYLLIISTRCKNPEFTCTDFDAEKLGHNIHDELMECIDNTLGV